MLQNRIDRRNTNRYIPYRLIVEEVIDESIPLNFDNINRISSLLFNQWYGALDNKCLLQEGFFSSLFNIRDYLLQLMKDLNPVIEQISSMEYISKEALDRLEGIRKFTERVKDLETHFDFIEITNFTSKIEKDRKEEEKRELLEHSGFFDHLIDVKKALNLAKIDLRNFEEKIIDLIHEMNILQYNLEHQVLKEIPVMIAEGKTESIHRVISLYDWAKFFIEQLSPLLDAEIDYRRQLRHLASIDLDVDFNFSSVRKYEEVDLLELLDF